MEAGPSSSSVTQTGVENVAVRCVSRGWVRANMTALLTKPPHARDDAALTLRWKMWHQLMQLLLKSVCFYFHSKLQLTFSHVSLWEGDTQLFIFVPAAQQNTHNQEGRVVHTGRSVKGQLPAMVTAWREINKPSWLLSCYMKQSQIYQNQREQLVLLFIYVL